MSDVLNPNAITMDAKTAAERWGCTVNDVRSWCKEGAIEGATKPHVGWDIPACTARPLDKKLIREILWQLLELKNGSARTIDLTPWGVRKQDLESYLVVLENNGYITTAGRNQPLIDIALIRLTVKGLRVLGRNPDRDKVELPPFLAIGVTAGGRFTAEVIKGLV